jgi:phosphotransferase system  glucose/maltose/N-acetylglucosamine-specific IIC component
MRNLVANHPALNYLDVVLRARIASARAAAEGEGEDRQLGASAVEWVVITMIVLVLVGIAAAIIIPDITAKSNAIGTCINNSGTGNACTP